MTSVKERPYWWLVRSPYTTRVSVKGIESKEIRTAVAEWADEQGEKVEGYNV